jgi:hypothetical protein
MARRYRTSVKLLGGFYCQLLDTETNEWAEYMVAHDSYRAFVAARDNAAALDCVVNGGATQLYTELKAALAELEAARRGLYFVGKQWHESVIVPRVREEDAER